MDLKARISGYYNEVRSLENLPPIPLVFCRVGKGGACVEYNPVTKRPINVQVDIRRCGDVGYALLHEIAHLKLGIKKGYYGHNAEFRRVENDLVDRYMYSAISFKYKV